MLRFGALFVAVLVFAISGPQAFSQQRSFSVGSIAQVADGAINGLKCIGKGTHVYRI